MELDFSDEYKNGRSVCEKNSGRSSDRQLACSRASKSFRLPSPRPPCSTPWILSEGYFQKMYKYFETKNWTIIVFIDLILLLAYFQARLVWKDAVSKRRSHPQKNHLLNWKRIYVSNLSKWVWSDTKSVILKTFSLISRLFLIHGNTWCAIQGDRQPKSQEEQPEKYTNTKRHWLNIYWNAFQWMAWNLSNPAWAI